MLAVAIAASGTAVLMLLLGLTVYSQRARVLRIGFRGTTVEMDRPPSQEAVQTPSDRI
jgi:hypothetical protein